MLDGLIEAVRAGHGQTLVLHGEPGVGKTALLDYLVDQASGCRVVRAAGVQSEMELAFSGLHQLLAPMLDRLERVPVPQRDALRTAFGMSPGVPPDRFMVALAVLSLLSALAEECPLICVVDDEHWLDRTSAQAIAFVARRLSDESVGLVLASRSAGDEVAGLPELAVEGLRDSDALSLLDSVLIAPVDVRVREQIVSETRGNPLALLELPRGVTPAQLAGGFGLLSAMSLSGRIESTFQRELDALPEQTRRLLLLAAADPVGEPALLWQAAQRLEIPAHATGPAAAAGLLEFGSRLRFRHPLVRSAVYRSASPQDRQDVHRALADVTDPEVDPDRRAWHRAQATSEPDEAVAAELARSADRAQARGGSAAAAAFLERAAALTPEPACRAQRLLAAAKAKRDAGALDASLGLLVAVEAGPLDAHQGAELEHLRGQIAIDQQRASDAARLFLGAARRLEPLNTEQARETHLDSLLAAMWAADLDGPRGLQEAAKAARAAPPGREPPRPVDLLLDALAVRLTEGYTAAIPAMTRALELVCRHSGPDDAGSRLWRGDSVARASGTLALELWDAESWHAVAARQVQFARETGALVPLRSGLNYLARAHLLAGELSAAALLIDESRLIAEATGYLPTSYAEMELAAWSGQEARAFELIESASQATAAGGPQVFEAAYASSVLYNGLGCYDLARDAAWQAFERGAVGYGPLVVAELAEAASKTGDASRVDTALKWLSERTRATPSDWVLGIEARVRALGADGDAGEALFRESIDRLGRTRVRVELARSHLLCGEWLRRRRRSADAREQLRTAHEMFTSMGVEAFAARARRELLVIGDTVRKCTVEPYEGLTAQEAHIAQLASDGLSNPEIGARLFISPRTVKYHLHKVFTKLGICSRTQLRTALPKAPGSTAST